MQAKDTGTATLTVRMNQSLKASFEETCEEMGINMSAAVNMFAKQVVEQQRIPFEVRAKNGRQRLMEAVANVEAGKNLVGPFTSMEDLMAYLDGDDDDAV